MDDVDPTTTWEQFAWVFQLCLVIVAACLYYSCRPPPMENPTDAREFHRKRVELVVERRRRQPRLHGAMYTTDTCCTCFRVFEDESSWSFFTTLWKRLNGEESAKRVYLSCGHACCANCLVTWLSEKRTCPWCRREVSDISTPVHSTLPPASHHSAQLPQPRLPLEAYFRPVTIPPPSLITFGSSSTVRTPIVGRGVASNHANAALFDQIRPAPAPRPRGQPFVFLPDVQSFNSQESAAFLSPSRRANRRR